MFRVADSDGRVSAVSPGLQRSASKAKLIACRFHAIARHTTVHAVTVHDTESMRGDSPRNGRSLAHLPEKDESVLRRITDGPRSCRPTPRSLITSHY